MGFYTTDERADVQESCQENLIPPSKNRVWNFFTTSETCAGFFESQPVESHQEKWPTPTTTASGVHYYGYRQYSPELGRWLSRDPLGEAGHEIFKSGSIKWENTSEIDEMGEDDSDNDSEWFAENLGIEYIPYSTVYLFSANDSVNAYDAQGESWVRVCWQVGKEGVKYGWRKVVVGYKYVAKRVTVDGPCGTRIVQLRWVKEPVFRLDYGPIPGSEGKPTLHCHFKCVGDCKTHIPIWPPGKPR